MRAFARILDGDPRIRIERLRLSSQLFDARGLSAPLDDARLQLRVARAETDELFPAKDGFDGRKRGGRRFLGVRMGDLLEGEFLHPRLVGRCQIDS